MYYEKFADGTIKSVQDEIPFKIPEGWEWSKLQDIGEWRAGSTPSRANPEFYGGDIPWIKTGDLNNSYIYTSSEYITELAMQKKSLKKIKSGAVLIAMYGATIGKLGILKVDATTNQACISCVNYNGIFNRFLFYFLMFSKDQLITLGQGGAQPNISKALLMDYFIPIPPHNEQINIVERVESFFKIFDEINQLQKDLSKIEKRLKEKTLTLAMQGKLLSQDPTDEPASILINQIKEEKEKLISEGKIKRNKNKSTIVRRGESYYELIGNKEIDITDKIPYTLPSTWKWIKLNEIFEVRRGASPRPIKDYITEDSGINWIKIGDTSPTSKYITKANDKITFSAIKKTRLVNKGDLLLSNSMSFGRPYILKIDGAIHDGWLQLAPLYSNFSLDFLYYVLYSEVTKKQLLQVASGTAVKNLNSKKVEVILLPMAPINEQNRIVKKIEAILQV